MNALWGILTWIWPTRPPIQLPLDAHPPRITFPTSASTHSNPNSIPSPPLTPLTPYDEDEREHDLESQIPARNSNGSARHSLHLNGDAHPAYPPLPIAPGPPRTRRRSSTIENYNHASASKAKALEAELTVTREMLVSLRSQLAQHQNRTAHLESLLSDAHSQLQLERSSKLEYERQLADRAAELNTLQSFLTKADALSGAQVLQAVLDLNSALVQLCATIADAAAPSLSPAPRNAVDGAHAHLVRGTLGPVICSLLEGRSHAQDSMAVQLALQAWEVYCCAQVFAAFCFGLPDDADRLLRAVFARMLESEPQSAASRWRALTHAHARSMLERPSQTQSTTTLANGTVLTPDSPSTRVLDTSMVISVHARGLLSILSLAGCTDPSLLSLNALRARFEAPLGQVVQSAHALARSVREEVMSACFEIASAPRDVTFVSDEMEDVLAGAGQGGEVLCAVEFGLVCVTRTDPTTVPPSPVAEGPTSIPEPEVRRRVLLKPKVLLHSAMDLL